MKLEGRLALVTGAGQGIGKSTALSLAEEGADVAVVDINGDAVENTRAAIAASGRRAIAIQADMGDLGDIERIVEGTARELGGIDILINNAAIVSSDEGIGNGCSPSRQGCSWWRVHIVKLHILSTVVKC